MAEFLGKEYKGADAIAIVNKVETGKYISDFKKDKPGTPASRLTDDRINDYYFVVPSGTRKPAGDAAAEYNTKLAIKDHLVPNLVKAAKIDNNTSLPDLKINAKADATKKYADTKYNELKTKLATKAKSELDKEIDKIGADAEKTAMKSKMTDTDPQKMLDALEIMQKFVEVKDAQTTDATKLTELTALQTKLGDGKKKSKELKQSNDVQDALNDGYAGKDKSTIVVAIVAKITGNNFTPEEKQAYAEEIAPRLLAVKALSGNSSTDALELIRILKYNKFHFLASENLKDSEADKLDEDIRKLNEYISGSGSQHTLFDGLSQDDKDAITKLRTEMQSRVDKMREALKEKPGDTPDFSP
ncbi:1073_t:CDS:2 [Ambispora leptoticha]|uniref:1073_t:CDS:1 n=1 Tax=Ambispora leptoticha TaxID=144679 RepID=A0A9N8YYG7_9GLOM|nr:1073_t:CDS:2 [Ambispora leptoticha]